MTPRCRVCNVKLGAGAIRFQMTRRCPQDRAPVRLWWLCDRCICEVEDACDTVRDLYFGPPREALLRIGSR